MSQRMRILLSTGLVSDFSLAQVYFGFNEEKKLQKKKSSWLSTSDIYGESQIEKAQLHIRAVEDQFSRALLNSSLTDSLKSML